MIAATNRTTFAVPIWDSSTLPTNNLDSPLASLARFQSTPPVPAACRGSRLMAATPPCTDTLVYPVQYWSKPLLPGQLANGRLHCGSVGSARSQELIVGC